MAEDYNELNHDEECWLPKAKDISVWHFDKWKVDKPEDVYTDVCTFDLDFTEDIKKSLEHIVTTNHRCEQLHTRQTDMKRYCLHGHDTVQCGADQSDIPQSGLLHGSQRSFK